MMKQQIKILLEEAILKAKEGNSWPEFEVPEITVDYPKNEQFGDYTCNIAMILAKKVGKSPLEIAENLKSQISNLNAEDFEKIEVAAPGYLNLYLSKQYFQNVAAEIEKQKESFGTLEIGNGNKINNEFISANPTGPLHLGNGRGGFYGDSLSRVLRKAGFDVTNEYYVNDAGTQIEKLGHSVLKDDQAVYGGEYIDELNAKYGNLTDVRAVGEEAALEILENYIKKTVTEKMGIEFDVWMSERKLYEEKFVDKALEDLKDKGLAYENEGALWLKTTEFGDDKDRVLIKANGEKTYFASDCGYILNKLERGYDRIIESWGADHHGYITRFSAACKALGFSGDLKFIIVQLVRLVKDGKEVRMSKRAGNVVTIDDLIEEVGGDVARFFFLMYSPDTHMNFDLGLAKQRSQKNPVFYVQYAHARICSILAKAKELESYKVESYKDLNLLTHEKEIALMRELAKFPELIAEISESYEVHKLPHYAIKLADKFHSFYAACKVIDQENLELSGARLILIDAVRIVLGQTLNLIGVEAPEKM